MVKITIDVPEEDVLLIKKIHTFILSRKCDDGEADRCLKELIEYEEWLEHRNRYKLGFVKPGSVFMCNFKSGFRKSEINKIRPVIVVSGRSMNNSGQCIVVSVSSVEPKFPKPYKYKLPRDACVGLPAGIDVKKVDKFHLSWVKCDVIHHISHERLNRLHFPGFGYASCKLRSDVLVNVRKAILSAIGMQDLTRHL